MGTDKALIEFRGRPLVGHALGILREAGLAASIAGARSALGAYAPVVEDSNPGLGPLGGICTALASTAARWVVFLPVDLPMLPAPMVGCLLSQARDKEMAITITSVTGFAQTFPAVLDRAVLPCLLSELEAGRRGCYSAFQAAAARLGQPVHVVFADLLAEGGQVVHPEGLAAADWFFNINSAQDLRRAEADWPGSVLGQ
jgi:molybdopterin-guanine dinucleotide biosynthesis protein A